MKVLRELKKIREIKRNMKWSNLLKNKCPECGRNLWFDKDEPFIICPDYFCGFMVDQARMQEITMKLTSRKLDWDADLEGSELSTDSVA
jgi:hypothetical protein